MDLLGMYTPFLKMGKDDPPAPSDVYLVLEPNPHYQKTDDGRIRIGVKLGSPREIDVLVDQLKRELDEFRDAAMAVIRQI